MNRRYVLTTAFLCAAASSIAIAAATPPPAALDRYLASPNNGQWFDPATVPAPIIHRTTGRDDTLCKGWPVDLQAPGAGFPYTPTLFDADGDGADEIFLTGGDTFGLRGDGTFLPGWPTHEHQYMGYGTNAQKPGPSVADMDDDGDWEILWSERDWWAGGTYMWCFNGRNFDGTNLPGYPQYAPDDYSNALDVPYVLADVDDDGDLEAWGPHTLGNNFTHYRLSGFDHLGNRLFTTDLPSSENILDLYYGDLDGNGVKEMFAVAMLGSSYRLHVFDSDGSEATGYPIVLFTLGGTPCFGPPVPFDLDGDGDLEILFGYYASSTSYARCYHHDGTPCDGFPIQIATSSQLFYVGLGDVTGDGGPEMIVFDNHLGDTYRVFAFDLATGLLLPGWPYHVPNWPHGFPTVVDVDDDGIQDICAATDGGEVYAFTGTGQLIPDFPKAMNGPSISGVAAGDIDGDGLVELVAATWDGWVYAWDTHAHARPGTADWPMRGIDARNTGVFGQRNECPADVNEDGVVDIDDLFDILAHWGEGPGKYDVNDDGTVDIDDLFDVLANWGPCP